MSEYKISVKPETFPNGMIKLTFTSNGGKFGTDELLDVIKMTPEQLLNILQANDPTTSNDTALNIDLVSESWYSKLKCLMEGLEINNIDLLLATGKNGDYRNLGELMQKRIKELM